MREPDFDAFSAMLEDIAAFYPTAKAPTPGVKAMFFRALSAYTLAQVRAGFDAHLRDPQRGRFAPLPADIVAQVEGNAKLDGRPGPEEAWAIAIQAADENRTLVWTGEIAAAWGIARTVFERGDEVGARMAFKDAYGRIVAEARRDGLGATWMPTIGADPDQRDEALQRAHSAGLLPAPEALRALPAPDNALSFTNTRMPDVVRQKLLAARARMLARASEPEPEKAPGRPINLPPLPERTAP
jgi:hypothetical protein